MTEAKDRARNMSDAQRLERVQRFSAAVFSELSALNILATAYINAGLINRGLMINDFLIHQSLERSMHAERIIKNGQWPTMSGRAITPEVIGALAAEHIERSRNIPRDLKDIRENWRFIRVRHASRGQSVQTRPPAFDDPIRMKMSRKENPRA